LLRLLTAAFQQLVKVSNSKVLDALPIPSHAELN